MNHSQREMPLMLKKLILTATAGLLLATVGTTAANADTGPIPEPIWRLDQPHRRRRPVRRRRRVRQHPGQGLDPDPGRLRLLGVRLHLDV